MVKYFALAGVLTLCACTTPTMGTDDEAAGYTPITFASQKATAGERMQCEKVGGEVMRVGRLGSEACVQSLPDAGKICSDSADCIGRCVLENAISEPLPGTQSDGVCEATDNVFGCTTLVTNGKIEGTLCID